MVNHDILQSLPDNWRERGLMLIEKQRVIYDYCADELEAALAARGREAVEDQMPRNHSYGANP